MVSTRTFAVCYLLVTVLVFDVSGRADAVTTEVPDPKFPSDWPSVPGAPGSGWPSPPGGGGFQPPKEPGQIGQNPTAAPVVTQPTQPVTQPTQPWTQPTQPVTQPTQPWTQPTQPSTRPTQPSTRPTQPPTPKPTVATIATTKPTTQTTPRPVIITPKPTKPPQSPIASPGVTQCGQSSHTSNHFAAALSGRIVGGVDAQKNEWPWQVSLLLMHPRTGKPQHFCGGVIITERHVLTAGHCVKNHLSLIPNPSMWKVRAGEHHMNQQDGTEQELMIERVVPYHGYFMYDKDIAILKLATPIKFGQGASPACLPTKNMDVTGMKCVASGWGKLDFEMIPTSPILKEVELDVFDNSICHNAYNKKYSINIREWHLCAGTLQGGKGTCQGDSGGPFVCKIDGRWHVMGLTSFGAGCAKPGYPDVYARVSYFTDWINQQVARL